MEMTPEQTQEMQEKIKNMSPEELKDFQKQQCIFCHIVSGKAQAKKVYEDEKAIGILDINPANPGHILLMPKEHYSIMPLIPDDEIEHLFKVSKHLSRAALVAFKSEAGEEDLGTTIFVANGAVAGQRAQHFMMHVIPRKENDGVEGLDLIEKTISKTDIKQVRDRIMPKIKELLGGDVEEETEEESEEKEDDQKEEKKEEAKPKKQEKKPKKQKSIVEAEFEEVKKDLSGGDEEESEEEPEDEESEDNDQEMDEETKQDEDSSEEEPDEEGQEDGRKGANLDDISRVLF